MRLTALELLSHRVHVPESALEGAAREDRRRAGRVVRGLDDLLGLMDGAIRAARSAEGRRRSRSIWSAQASIWGASARTRSKYSAPTPERFASPTSEAPVMAANQ
jgi:hypothetical protein